MRLVSKDPEVQKQENGGRRSEHSYSLRELVRDTKDSVSHAEGKNLNKHP